MIIIPCSARTFVSIILFKIDGISSAGSGKLTFTLRHEPKKPNTGLTDAGGSTDLEATFDIVVE